MAVTRLFFKGGKTLNRRAERIEKIWARGLGALGLERRKIFDSSHFLASFS
jgi:hypothetical protein